MNWRWIAPPLVVVAAIEAIFALAAYGSGTWNLQHTEVLHRWDAVREVCLIFVPMFLGGCALFVGLVIASMEWASRGGR